MDTIGKRGPELFMPRTAGHGIPNHQLGAGNTPTALAVVTAVGAGSGATASPEAAAQQ